MLTQEQLTFLEKSLTFWSHLREEEKNQITGNCNAMHYKAGETIHSGDADCLGLLLVKRGGLRVYLLSEDGREVTLYRLRPGELCVLSASCILQNITFEVHIDAEEETDVLVISAAAYAQVSDQNIYVEAFTGKEAISRFSDVMWAMEQILFMSFDKRLAVFLLDEIARHANGEENQIMMTHEQIAKYIGSAREVVSRMLKYFANEGWVELHRGGLKVLDKKALRQLL